METNFINKHTNFFIINIYASVISYVWEDTTQYVYFYLSILSYIKGIKKILNVNKYALQKS